MGYLDGDLVAGYRVGQFLLDTELKDLIKLIDFDYDCEEIANGPKIIKDKSCNIEFYLNETNNKYRITSIRVSKDYKGKFLNKFGIGTTMVDLKGVSEYTFDKELLEQNTYYFELFEYKGIEFVTEIPWDEATPIICIDIFKE
jgi:hypothetical protein